MSEEQTAYGDTIMLSAGKRTRDDYYVALKELEASAMLDGLSLADIVMMYWLRANILQDEMLTQVRE